MAIVTDKQRQDRTPIFEAVTRYYREAPAYFRIPGHRFERGISERWRSVVGDEIFKFDLTETSLLDDLHHPESAILEAETLAAEVFGADRCFFLVNGTTCGNEAMIASSAFSGQKIAIPRNAHKSALMGLIISGAEPVYIMPELSAEWGIHGGITPESVRCAFEEHPDVRGVMVVSPTYYGICSDLRGIAEVCHTHGAALLVDEAHGAHLYFSDRLPDGAMTQGADVCAQSIHKVTGSLTQSSMLQVREGLVDMSRIEQTLHIVQSTSPSYLLMTSLDVARRDLALFGAEMAENAIRLAEGVRTRLNNIPGIRCPGDELTGHAGISGYDKTRLIISAAELGITGFDLKRVLYEKHGVDLELADYMNALAIVTFANTDDDMNRLVEAVADIAAGTVCVAGADDVTSEMERPAESATDKITDTAVGMERSAGAATCRVAGATDVIAPGEPLVNEIKLPGLPTRKMTPREAYFSESRSVPWIDAAGHIAGEMIAPYPPGIPVIYPGEVLTDEIWTYIENFRAAGRHMHGPADGTLRTFKVL